jgi:hypothetical protein
MVRMIAGKLFYGVGVIERLMHMPSTITSNTILNPFKIRSSPETALNQQSPNSSVT